MSRQKKLKNDKFLNFSWLLVLNEFWIAFSIRPIGSATLASLDRNHLPPKKILTNVTKNRAIEISSIPNTLYTCKSKTIEVLKMGAIIDGSYQNYYDPMLGQKLPLVFDAEKEFVSNSIFSITTGLVSGDLLNPIKTLGSIFCGIGKKSANPTETPPVTQQSEEIPTEEYVEETINKLKSLRYDLTHGDYIDIPKVLDKYNETNDPIITNVLKKLELFNLTSNDSINPETLFNNLYNGDKDLNIV